VRDRCRRLRPVLPYDPRGPDHPRPIGTAVDIGAYAYDPGDPDYDAIFSDGLD